jgi:hypothetical protein
MADDVRQILLNAVLSIAPSVISIAPIGVTVSVSSRGVGPLAGMFSVVLAIVELPLTVFLLPYVVVQSNSLV